MFCVFFLHRKDSWVLLLLFFSYQEAIDRISIQKCIMLHSDKMSNSQAKGDYLFMQHIFFEASKHLLNYTSEQN